MALRLLNLSLLAATALCQVVDRGDIISLLFNGQTDQCSVVAGAGYCSNGVIAWTCPVSCATGIDESAYCVDNDALMMTNYGFECNSADTLSCTGGDATGATPSFAKLACPDSCGSAPSTCPCAFWCNSFTCNHAPQCTGCPASTCGGASHEKCASWCSAWTCGNTNVNLAKSFFWDQCGGCDVCNPWNFPAAYPRKPADAATGYPGGFYCESWCNEHTTASPMCEGCVSTRRALEEKKEKVFDLRGSFSLGPEGLAKALAMGKAAPTKAKAADGQAIDERH